MTTVTLRKLVKTRAKIYLKVSFFYFQCLKYLNAKGIMKFYFKLKVQFDFDWHLLTYFWSILKIDLNPYNSSVNMN